MGVERLFNLTMTVKRKLAGASTDAHGQVVYTWPNLAGQVGLSCRLEGGNPGGESERALTLGSGQVVKFNAIVFCGVGVDVLEKDRLVIGGRTFEVTYVNREPGGRADSHFEVYGIEVRT